MKGVIFDLDGTLIQSLPDIAGSMNRTLRRFGLPEYPLAAYNTMVGNGAYTLARRAVGERQDLLDNVYRAYRLEYAAHTCVDSYPYEGIIPMLDALNSRSVPACVFSNKDHQDVLSVVGHYFPGIRFAQVRGRQEGVALKPDLEGALLIADALVAAPEEILYVGDTGTDMDCGANAAMITVGVTWGFRTRAELKEHRACHIIDRPGELLEIISRY